MLCRYFARLWRHTASPPFGRLTEGMRDDAHLSPHSSRSWSEAGSGGCRCVLCPAPGHSLPAGPCHCPGLQVTHACKSGFFQIVAMHHMFIHILASSRMTHHQSSTVWGIIMYHFSGRHVSDQNHLSCLADGQISIIRGRTWLGPMCRSPRSNVQTVRVQAVHIGQPNCGRYAGRC